MQISTSVGVVQVIVHPPAPLKLQESRAKATRPQAVERKTRALDLPIRSAAQ
jgi:hypothetical protein